MIAIGFDPGTARLGYGVIESDPDPQAIDYGVIVTNPDEPMARRLLWRAFTLCPQAMTSYQASCAGAYEVRTLRQLADAIAAVV